MVSASRQDSSAPIPDSNRLGADFFARHHLDVARDLIGCTLVWDQVSGTIVETEAYAVDGDEACHTSFRPTARAFFESHSPGTTYVYLNYGIHWMLNVLALDGIVLIRALEPLSGLETMRNRRGIHVENQDLCAGPGRIGQALRLGKDDHGKCLLQARRCILPRGPEFDEREAAASKILADRRIGLTRAVEKPWRFLIAGHPCVSVPYAATTRRRRISPRPTDET
ncbi:MAG: DNA-3-methyladenine glycosylase [Planctomyces sp.]|nr:DNA-3-methyladenine glycosylase [Planctomyces sp.]